MRHQPAARGRLARQNGDCQRPRSGMRHGFLARVALAGAVLHPLPLHAHSWYPPECCTGQDCKKVDRIETLPDGTLLMHFSGQQVIVPRGFTQQPSQDADAHVCVYRTVTGRWAPRCVFVPAGA